MPDKPPQGSMVTHARNGDKRARGMVVEWCAPTIWSCWYLYLLATQNTMRS
jgi:hypothetical protein